MDTLFKEMQEKLDTTEYYGKLTHEEIRLIQEVFDIQNKQNPCHMNAIIRMKISKTLDSFFEADNIEEPTLENRFIKTIKIQY
jgi:hypothetical protein